MYKIDTFFYFALVDANALRCEHNAAEHRICFQGNGLFEVYFENSIRKRRRRNAGQNDFLLISWRQICMITCVPKARAEFFFFCLNVDFYVFI